eukprot:311786-Pyramimonas_sp.AAC.1
MSGFPWDFPGGARLPLDWRRSRGCGVPKPTAIAPELRPVRLVHRVRPFSRACSKHPVVRGSACYPERVVADHLHGGVSHRRREAAIKMQLIAGWRLSRLQK